MLNYALEIAACTYFLESPSSRNRKESADLGSPLAEKVGRFVAEENTPLEEQTDSVLETSPLSEPRPESQALSVERTE